MLKSFQSYFFSTVDSLYLSYRKLPGHVRLVLTIFSFFSLLFISHYYDCSFSTYHSQNPHNDHPYLRFDSFPFLTEDSPLVSQMESSNVDMSCQYAGRPTCCALTEGNMSSDIYPRKYEDMKFPHRLKNCEVKREYISSPYEQRHLMKALEIQQISSEDERRSLLLSFMFQDFPHVNRWLKRIKDHVVLSTSPIPNEDDFEYLSRFKVTRICGHNYINEYSWYEWIEPITIYARHPFSYTKCPPYGFNLTTTETGSYEIYYQGRIQTIDYNPALINTDYVLLQNALELNESNRYSMSRRDRIPKRYLFDTGSYTFDSSIMWFLCSYLQVSRAVFSSTEFNPLLICREELTLIKSMVGNIR